MLAKSEGTFNVLGRNVDAPLVATMAGVTTMAAMTGLVGKKLWLTFRDLKARADDRVNHFAPSERRPLPGELPVDPFVPPGLFEQYAQARESEGMLGLIDVTINATRGVTDYAAALAVEGARMVKELV